MKRAAPSSNLFTKGSEVTFLLFYLFLSSSFKVLGCFSFSENLLLSNEEWVEEVGGDSVSVNGTRSHATQA